MRCRYRPRWTRRFASRRLPTNGGSFFEYRLLYDLDDAKAREAARIARKHRRRVHRNPHISADLGPVWLSAPLQPGGRQTDWVARLPGSTRRVPDGHQTDQTDQTASRGLLAFVSGNREVAFRAADVLNADSSVVFEGFDRFPYNR